jgi:hypothetical protein
MNLNLTVHLKEWEMSMLQNKPIKFELKQTVTCNLYEQDILCYIMLFII